MNSFTFIAVALALVMAVSAQSKEDLPHNDFFSETQKCVPKKIFVDKCNECECVADGTGAVCTRMACQTPEKPHIDGFQSTGGLSCPPGEKFFDGCNACTCSQSGSAAICTPTADCNVHARSRRSANDDSDLPHIDNFHETNECTPGQSFKHQCNICRCGTDGKGAACTLMLCFPDGKIRIDNFFEGRKCPAGKTFYDKCNTCRCNADGASAACTLMACTGFE